MSHIKEGLWPFVPVNNKAFDELEIVRADGAYIYTSDGKKILDASAGAVVGNIGWGREEVAQACYKSLTELTFALPPFATPDRLKLVNLLVNEWLPEGLTKISFFGSGSEAADTAIRLARQYQVAKGQDKRWKVIGRDTSYHGTSIATLAVGGHNSRRKDFEPLLIDMPHAPACYCLRCPMKKEYPSCDVACARELETTIEKEGADTVAAFIVEPIVGTSGGSLVPPDEYWPVIVDICKRHEILLIADEILTGFGRTGMKFAVDHWNIKPDILLLGKGLSGGYAPISAVVTTEEITNTLHLAGKKAMYHTYGGHPSSCAAAAKVLEIIKRENLIERVAELGPVLEKKLNKLLSNAHVAEVRGRGFFYSIEVVEDSETLQCYPESDNITFKIVDACVKRGVFVYFGGTGKARDIICVAPAFNILESQMDEIVDVLSAAIDEVCG